MCDCVQSAAVITNLYKRTRFRESGQAQCSWNSKPLIFASEILTGNKNCSVMKEISNRKCKRIFRRDRLFMDQRFVTDLGVFGSNAFDLNSELRLKEGGDEHFELGLQTDQEKLEELELSFINDNEAFDNKKSHGNLKRDQYLDGGVELLNFNESLLEEGKGRVLKAEDIMSVEGNGKNDDLDLEDDQAEEFVLPKPKPKHKPMRKMESRSRLQLMKRSSIIAKQVIGVESACNLGFVSQLWVDTATWAVLEVEVRPNLLSSESVKFLLGDIKKIGDVVLVQEENCIQNEFRTVGLETLVGYSVVTPGQRNLGKVRGYTFNINSGTVESLELDAFGYSVIPSSLVSTYALFTEDVLEVVSDVIIVHEAAVSHIQRLTKGLLGTNYVKSSSINLKYQDMEPEPIPPVKDCKSKRKASKRKLYSRTKDLGDDFELPMDYM